MTVFRNLLIAKGTATRPYYCEVEYLESTGTQYIDSGKKATYDTRIVADIEITTQSTNRNRIFGNYKDTAVAFTLNCSTTNACRFGNKSSSPDLLKLAVDERHKVENGKDGLFLDGELVYRWGEVSSFTTAGNVSLLASSLTETVTSTLTNGLVGKCYGIQWFESGVLVNDWMPCFYNGQIGMWDKVNEVFYANAGTGDFVVGPIKEER